MVRKKDIMNLIPYVVDCVPRFIGGVRELHKLNSCHKLPAEEWRMRIGNYTSCEDALARAKVKYGNVEPCPYCCYDEYYAPEPEVKEEITF